MPSIDRQFDDNGDPIVNNQGGGVNLFESDVAEWRKMDRFTPAPQGSEGMSVYGRLAAYGIGKYIDNTFPTEPRGIQGNTKPGSFAGANGRTYTQNPNQQLATGTVGGVVSGIAGMSPMILIAVGAALFFALRK